MSKAIIQTPLTVATALVPSGATISAVPDSIGYTWDMPQTGTNINGTSLDYNWNIGGVNIFAIHAESDGAGSVQAMEVRIYGDVTAVGNYVIQGGFYITGGDVFSYQRYRNLGINSSALVDVTLGISGIVLCDSIAGNLIRRLPPAIDALGVHYYIKKTNSNNQVTIIPNGSDTIDGAASKILLNKDAVHLFCDGTYWYIF